MFDRQELDIKRPGVLYTAVVEVDERVTLMGYTSDPRRAERAVVFDDEGKVRKGYDGEEHAEGEVVKGLSGEAVRIIKRLDVEEVTKGLKALYEEGYRSLAIVLMHSFTYPGLYSFLLRWTALSQLTSLSPLSRSREADRRDRQLPRVHAPLAILRLPPHDPNRRSRNVLHRRRILDPGSTLVHRRFLLRFRSELA